VKQDGRFNAELDENEQQWMIDRGYLILHTSSIHTANSSPLNQSPPIRHKIQIDAFWPNTLRRRRSLFFISLCFLSFNY